MCYTCTIYIKSNLIQQIIKHAHIHVHVSTADFRDDTSERRNVSAIFIFPFDTLRSVKPRIESPPPPSDRSWRNAGIQSRGYRLGLPRSQHRISYTRRVAVKYRPIRSGGGQLISCVLNRASYRETSGNLSRESLFRARRYRHERLRLLDVVPQGRTPPRVSQLAAVEMPEWRKIHAQELAKSSTFLARTPIMCRWYARITCVEYGWIRGMNDNVTKIGYWLPRWENSRDERIAKRVCTYQL